MVVPVCGSADDEKGLPTAGLRVLARCPQAFRSMSAAGWELLRLLCLGMKDDELIEPCRGQADQRLFCTLDPCEQAYGDVCPCKRCGAKEYGHQGRSAVQQRCQITSKTKPHGTAEEAQARDAEAQKETNVSEFSVPQSPRHET